MTAGMMIAASILAGRALAPVELLSPTGNRSSPGGRPMPGCASCSGIHPPRARGMPLPAPTGSVAVEAASAVAPGTSG